MAFRHRSQKPRKTKSAPESEPLRLASGVPPSSTGEPAFLARPDGAPIYYGFPIIESSEVDGFRFGMITDFVAQPSTHGDAFVVAPDNSRAGLVWESEVAEPYFDECLAPDDRRWGVWAVGSPASLRSERDTQEFLRLLLPELRSRWQKWKHGP
jgi:hypothetical protein